MEAAGKECMRVVMDNLNTRTIAALYSIFGRECLNRHIPDVETLKREIAALEAE
jgi:hypothetical protein